MKYVINTTSSNLSLAKCQLTPYNIIQISDNKYAKDEAKANELIASKSIAVADNNKDAISLCSFARNSKSYIIDITNIDTKTYFQVVNELEECNNNITTVTNYKANNKVIATYFDCDNILTIIQNKITQLNELKTTKNDEFLEEAKTIKNNQITQARDDAIDAGVTYKEHLFQSAEKDRNLLTSTISLYQLQGSVPEGFTWIAADNTQVEMTLDELVELGSLMATQVSENTYKARTLKDSVNAMTSVAEIEAVTYA